jgi:Domain of unknown function (DUF5916)/Carbohydrate family 9 binding domain-like
MAWLPPELGNVMRPPFPKILIFAPSMKAVATLFVLIGLLGTVAWTQALVGDSATQAERSLHIARASSEIKLDGDISEAAWQAAELATDFVQQFPYDTAAAISHTDVRVTYNDQYLYISAVCWDDKAGDYIVQSLKRDFSYPVTDAFAVYVDPFNDKTNGFNFTVSPLGVQREGTIEGGGSFGVTTNWDNKWFAEVKQYPDRWVVEMAIPFKTLRFNDGVDTWRINFSRNNLKCNENSCWIPVPRAYNVASLAFTGQMIWDQPPKKTGANVSVIPYLLGRYTGDYRNRQEAFKPNAGLDAKVAVTSSLNLDLTVNPDFSQVEVDRQVTNLSRFSLFFPERRQFFIENSDLFGQQGFSQIRPFFSRRIGLNSGQAIPILGGMRLSGKLNQNWRIGLMNMQTNGVGNIGLQGQNYSVAVVQRKLFTRSSVGAIFVNRLGFRGDAPNGEDFNSVIGLDYILASANNRWQGKGFYHRSFGAVNPGRQSANAVWLRYQTQNININYNHEYVDANYDAQVGFVPRHRYFRLENSASYRFFPQKAGKLLFHGPEGYLSWYWDNQSWQGIERNTTLGYRLSWQNRSELAAGGEQWYVFLQNPFDPSNTGAVPLPDSIGYAWRNVWVEYNTDFRKRLVFTGGANMGGYYGGQKYNLSGTLSYRAQPWGIFSIDFDQNYLVLPNKTVFLNLISPKVELSFTRSLFFTTFFQFNTQTQNFNINARLQWRFKPMSDLFLVVTDNYATPGFGVKNRAVVLKLNYWFTL